MMKKTVVDYQNEVFSALLDSVGVHQGMVEHLASLIETSAIAIVNALRADKKVIAFGNGGSAAQAQHLVGELLGRYSAERVPLPAICLSSDSSVVSCIANDYGYGQVFSRQVRALCQPGDIAIGMSTSGRSLNVVEGLEEAARVGATTIALTGQDGMQVDQVTYLLAVPSRSTARIQEGHLVIIHCWCDVVDVDFG